MGAYHKYKTATFVCLSFTIVFFCLIFLIPLVVERGAEADILTQNNLRSDNYFDWGNFPGSYGVNIQKTFTLFDLKNKSDNENLTFSLESPYPFTLNLSYSESVFVPNTNGQIQAKKVYQHVSSDEDALRNHTITQPNLGIYSAIDRESNFLDIHYVSFALFRMMDALNGFGLLYLTHGIYEYYVKNQDITYAKIFLKNGLLSNATADQIWNHPVYGWSSIMGLRFWVEPIMTSDFSSHPNWILLKSVFNLTDDQMNTLSGSYSRLCELYTALQDVINTKYKNSFQDVFTFEQNLGVLQWANQISMTPYLTDIPTFYSLTDLNTTEFCAPEIAIMATSPTLFNAFDFENLLSFDGEGITTSNNMLNFESIYSLLKTPDPNYINYLFSFQDLNKSQALIQYVSHIFNNCLIREDLGNDRSKLRDIPASTKELLGFNNMLDYIISEPFDLLSLYLNVNLTKSAFETHYSDTCANLFNDPMLWNLAWICLNPELNPVQTVLPWVEAYYLGSGSDAWQNLMDKTNINQTQLVYLFSWTSFGHFLTNTQSRIAEHYNCSVQPCLTRTLALSQWVNSAISRNLPLDLVNLNETDTISNWNPQILPNVPEYYSFSQGSSLTNVLLTELQAERLFSSGVGGLWNFNERLYFIQSVLGNQESLLNSRFGLTLNQSKNLFDYWRNIVITSLFEGLFVEKTPYEFIFGYESNYLTRTRTRAPLKGGDANLTLFSIVKENNADDFEIDDPSNYFNIDTGLYDEANSRKVNKFYGNNTILKRKKYYNNGSLIYYFVNPWNQSQNLQGTDGFGFKPFIDKDENLDLFEDGFYRNLHLQCQGKTDCYGYTCQKYTIDESEFSKSDVFYTDIQGIFNLTSVSGAPIVASNPFMADVDGSAYATITVNNKSMQEHQSDASLTYLLVEQRTGVTTELHKSYQYNLQLKSNILLDGLVGNERFYPLLIETTDMKFNNERANYQFNDINYKIKTASIVRWLCVGLAALFFICFLISAVKYYKLRKSRSSSDGSEPLIKNEHV